MALHAFARDILGDYNTAPNNIYYADKDCKKCNQYYQAKQKI